MATNNRFKGFLTTPSSKQFNKNLKFAPLKQHERELDFKTDKIPFGESKRSPVTILVFILGALSFCNYTKCYKIANVTSSRNNFMCLSRKVAPGCFLWGGFAARIRENCLSNENIEKLALWATYPLKL